MVDWRRSRGKRPDADGLLGQGRSGETEGLDRRRCRPTPRVASSTTTGVAAAVVTAGAAAGGAAGMVGVIRGVSVDGALVNRMGLVMMNSSSGTAAVLVDVAVLLPPPVLTINPLPKGLLLRPSGLGGMLCVLKMGHRL